MLFYMLILKTTRHPPLLHPCTTCIQNFIWIKVRKNINSLSNFKYSIKQHDIHQCDRLFEDYPNELDHMNHKNVSSHGVKTCFYVSYLFRLANDNPSFTHLDKIGIGTQLQKWLRTRVVICPFSQSYVKENHVVWCPQTRWYN